MDEEKDEKMITANGLIAEMPLFVKEFIAGGVAGGFAKTAVAPLERIKILFQTRRAEFRSLGLSGSFTKIAKTEGLLGFYRGNGASVVRIVPYAALHYMAYEEYRRLIIFGLPTVERGPVLDLIAGAFAGGTAVAFTYPLDLVRTRLAFQVGESSTQAVNMQPAYKGISDCFSNIYRQGGLRGLYTGVGPTLYGIFPYAGLKFYFYEEMKRRVPKDREKDVAAKLVCGSVAGLLGQTLTYPLDVVRRQMQVQQVAESTNSAARGTWETLVTIIRTQGWRQLFSGLSINYIKVTPSVAIGFTCYDFLKAFLQVPSRDAVRSQVATTTTAVKEAHHTLSRTREQSE